MAGKILNTRVDPDVVEQAEDILNTLGISRSVAINMFYRMVILKKGLPWQVTLDETDYVMSNSDLVRQIKQSMEAFEEGNFFAAPPEVENEINRL